jgi:predicted extracellular nuclease
MKQVSKILGIMLMTVIFGASIVQAQTTLINEIRIDQTSTDNDEYFELVGVPGASLDGLTYLVIGDGSSGSGVIEAVVNLSGETIPAASSYFVAAESTFTLSTADLTTSLNFENSDNVTHLLVSGFTGVNGADLDTDDDGVLDITPWSTLVDCVALIEKAGSGDQTYCSTTVGPEDGLYVPGHVFWCDDGWHIGPFDPIGGDDTPGTANPCGTDDPPTVSSTSPADGATDVALDADISINFSEDVTVSGNWFDITCINSGAHSADVSGGLQNYVLNPDADFVAADECTVTVFANQVIDQDGTPDNMSSDYSFSFETVSNAITKIHEIQGSGSKSPEIGNIHTIEGVVVGDFQEDNQFGGFFVQEEDGDIDGDLATSEGIFVYNTSFAVNVGDVVRVTGRVAEYPSDPLVESNTQLTNVSNVVINGTASLPMAASVSLPIGAVSDWECYEGMLVDVHATSGALTVTEHYNLDRYGEVLLSSGGRLEQFTQGNAPDVAGYTAHLEDIAKHSILIDDGRSGQNLFPILNARGGNNLSPTNTLRGGDTVALVTGALDYRYNVYRVQPTQPVNYAATNIRPSSAPSIGGNIKVASFNVLNYFNGDGMGGGFPTPRGARTFEDFQRQRTKTIAAISKLDADIIGLMELENDGYGTYSAVQDLVDGLNVVAGPGTYAFIDPGTPALGSDEITVGIIYKPAVVSEAGTAAFLNTPGIFDGENTNRTPLAQTFEVVDADNPSFGEKFTIVVCHFKSKGDEDGEATGANEDAGDGQGYWNQRRVEGADAVTTWLAGDPTGGNDSDFLIIGDLNAYSQEDPIKAVENAGYTNLITDSYSYVFDGQWGSLDYALANSKLTPQVVGGAKWHINADEPDALDYSTRFNDPSLYAPDEFRASDHDPLLVGLNLASLEGSKLITDGEDRISETPIFDVFAGDIFTYTIEFKNPFEQAMYFMVADTLSTALQYLNGSFTMNAGTLEYTTPDLLRSGEPILLSFDVQVKDVPVGTLIDNTAWITAFTDLSDIVGSTLAAFEAIAPQAHVIPEPATLLLVGVGVIGILAFVRRRRRQKK